MSHEGHFLKRTKSEFISEKSDHIIVFVIHKTHAYVHYLQTAKEKNVDKMGFKIRSLEKIVLKEKFGIDSFYHTI